MQLLNYTGIRLWCYRYAIPVDGFAYIEKVLVPIGQGVTSNDVLVTLCRRQIRRTVGLPEPEHQRIIAVSFDVAFANPDRNDLLCPITRDEKYCTGFYYA